MPGGDATSYEDLPDPYPVSPGLAGCLQSHPKMDPVFQVPAPAHYRGGSVLMDLDQKSRPNYLALNDRLKES